MVTVPDWYPVEALPPQVAEDIRRRAIFEYCKWDPQVGDVSTFLPCPLVLSAAAWRELSQSAECLARELDEAETEILNHPEWIGELGLSRKLTRVLAEVHRIGRPLAGPRLVRFDFHLTTEGWRISEANADVPGGLNESTGYADLMLPHYPGCVKTGDPAQTYVEAVRSCLGSVRDVGLVFATAYSDDHQVMSFLETRLRTAGYAPHLVAPDQVQWHEQRARVRTPSGTWQEVGLLLRFYPGEWMENLPSSCGWPHFFHGAKTRLANPATALVVQSKRFPMLWDRLQTPMAEWRSRLPRTLDPRRAPWRDNPEWVLKPAFGRVGDGIGLAGVTEEREWKDIRRAVRWEGKYWVAQQRFQAVALPMAGQPWYPCIGVYTLDGRVIGAYGRMAERPLVNQFARDPAVFVREE